MIVNTPRYSAPFCKNGHQRTTDNLYADGKCKICTAAHTREVYQEHKVAAREQGKLRSNERYRRNPEFFAYRNAKRRCTNPEDDNWHSYGGRGIEFRFRDFAEFFGHIGNRPTPLHSLDRIDTNGHYETGNVRWATREQQHANKRKSFAQHVRWHINRHLTNSSCTWCNQGSGGEI